MEEKILINEMPTALMRMPPADGALIFYDFEVLPHYWCLVVMWPEAGLTFVIDDAEALRRMYEFFKRAIWIGFYSRVYDQWILKAILCGLDPYQLSCWIMAERQGWEFSDLLSQISLINFDLMPNPPIGLKVLEGFMGLSIHESEVPFDLPRMPTDAEKRDLIRYCMDDVRATIRVFLYRKDDFRAMLQIVESQKLPMKNIGQTETRITATVMGCRRQDFNDEFDYKILPCIRLKKYHFVQEFFENAPAMCRQQMIENGENPEDIDAFRKRFYEMELSYVAAGVPHKSGWGGIHGAPDKPLHEKGFIFHVDVNNYYPSLLIGHDLVTRAAGNQKYTEVYETRKSLKMQQLAAKDKAEKKKIKKAQLPYKKMLNALSGGMKDKFCSAYDPRRNNEMCVNGQLMLLMLIEMLEEIPGFRLLQSNTDGLIVKLPDAGKSLAMMNEICRQWEKICSTEACEIGLALDEIAEIFQKDVNNYLWISKDGSIGEAKGSYVKDLSPLSYDLPIVNEALKAYMKDGIRPEITINQCDKLIKFQKIVKLTEKYHHIYHNNYEYTNKVYRVFASRDSRDTFIGKVKCPGAKPEKIANTPQHCRIVNDDIRQMPIPAWLDRDYYIRLAYSRLEDFGIKI